MNGGMQTFDHEMSATLARRVRAQRRRCWRNAALAVSHLGVDANYVEGWIVTPDAPAFVIEHGWCEGDGRVVDPSYTSYVGPHDPPIVYFAGRRFSVAQAEAAVERGRLPFAWSHADATYWDAFNAAWSEATRRRFRNPLPATRVVHCRREAFDVFIGRPSEWANPFHVGRDGTRDEVISKYRRWLIRQPRLLRLAGGLRGKALGCHCAPLPCHGDVLAELADCGVDGAVVQHRAPPRAAPPKPAPITRPHGAPSRPTAAVWVPRADPRPRQPSVRRTRLSPTMVDIGVLVLGIVGILVRESVMEFLGFGLADPAQAATVFGVVRAIFGWLFVVLGVASLLDTMNPVAHRAQLRFMGSLWLGIGVGRLLSARIYGDPGAFGWLVIFAELVLGSTLWVSTFDPAAHAATPSSAFATEDPSLIGPRADTESSSLHCLQGSDRWMPSSATTP